MLHFRPTRWDRWCQQLEATVGELLPDQPVPLLKKRLELSREEAHKLWSEKRKEGWQPTKAQWHPPQAPPVAIATAAGSAIRQAVCTGPGEKGTAPFWSNTRHLPATQRADGSST